MVAECPVIIFTLSFLSFGQLAYHPSCLPLCLINCSCKGVRLLKSGSSANEYYHSLPPASYFISVVPIGIFPLNSFQSNRIWIVDPPVLGI